MPQANSTTSIPLVMEPRASLRTLPCSPVISAASSSVSLSRSSLKRNMTLARLSGGVAAHAGKAAAAAETASFTSSVEASDTDPVVSPVAGLYISPWRGPEPGMVLPLTKWPTE